MSDDQRPWWASANDEQTTTEDPVEAHRAARRGPGSPTGMREDAERRADGAEQASASDGAADEAGTPDSGPSGSSESPRSHVDAICGVCPICVLARTLGDTHPELLGHLTEAARHLAAAARAMLDTPNQTDPGPDRVERIDLD